MHLLRSMPISVLMFFSAAATLCAADPVKIDFLQARQKGKTIQNWEYHGKPGTANALFTLEKIDGRQVLRMRSDKSTGTLLLDISKVDLNRTPVMRWRWRVDKLPVGGDARNPDKDDQAIGIYVGSGGMFSQTSAAFRWETVTPKKAKGKCSYGLGAVKVAWHCLRNQDDPLQQWVVDEVHLADALKPLFNNRIPSKLALTVSANSQYSGTSSDAYLDYVEFLPAPSATLSPSKSKRK